MVKVVSRKNPSYDEKEHVLLLIYRTESRAMTHEEREVLSVDNEFVHIPDELGWKLVKPREVPAWLKEPGTIAELRRGHSVSQEEGKDWYKGVVVPPRDQRVNH